MPPLIESVAWLNVLFARMWRIPNNTAELIPCGNASHVFSAYNSVLDSQDNQSSKLQSDHCSLQNFDEGLEPFLSAYFSQQLQTILEGTRGMHPSERTIFSLHSLTLGKLPPLVKGIQLLGVGKNERILNMRLNVDFFLKDFSVLLGKLTNARAIISRVIANNVAGFIT